MEPISPTASSSKKNNAVTKTFKKILKPGEKKKKQKATTLIAVKYLIQYLEQHCLELEGICRISGNTIKVKELKKQLESEIHSGSELSHDLSKYDKHVVSGTLKMFLRDYDEPLLTFDLYKNFLASADIKEKGAKMAFIKSLLSALPKDHSDLVQVVLKFLYTLQLHSQKNKMTCSNLAIVFAPTLLRLKEETLESMMTDSNIISEISRFLIEEFNPLYEMNTTILYKLKSQDLGIKEEKKSVSEQLEDAKLTIDQLTKQLAEEARERSILETYSNSLDQKLQEQSECLKSVQEEKDSLSELLNEFRETNRKQSEEIQLLTDSKNKIETEKNQLQSLKEQLEKQNTQLNQDLQFIKQEHDKQGKELESIKKLYQTKLLDFEKLSKYSSEQSSQIATLTKDVGVKTDENNAFVQKVNLLTKERDDAILTSERVQGQITLLLNTNTNGKKGSLSKSVKKDYENAQKKLKDYEAKISLLEKEKYQLTDQLSKLKPATPTTTTTTTTTSSSKFIIGKKPNQKDKKGSPAPTPSTPPPPIDEDDLISVKKFAFYWMNLALKTDALVKGENCNIPGSEILEDLLQKNVRVALWNDYVLTKIKELN
ncbi:hypothetical protein CYY_002311 [Polysphondylium violaceum]|uniref:Rho-GAP domain-containing protein n=1 Tax=Polysphondylium violaceum TaxID=133409 RepID=A0A8J4Q826_9MYCE|nr:hypothetical protein CYY_002311 [Polysphondylium violaceum]